MPASMAQQRKEMLVAEQKKCFRTKQAFLATGAPYDDTGFDTDDLLGRRAAVRVRTEERMAKDSSGGYTVPTGIYQSRIERYLPKGAPAPAAELAGALASAKDDDIPF